eukprot:scaffold559_cov190-Alexandrium_tamarense.AAC.58
MYIAEAAVHLMTKLDCRDMSCRSTPTNTIQGTPIHCYEKVTKQYRAMVGGGGRHEAQAPSNQVEN